MVACADAFEQLPKVGSRESFLERTSRADVVEQIIVDA